MSDRAVSLQSVSIASRKGDFTSHRAVVETAIVHLDENFALSAKVKNTSDAPIKVAVEVHIKDALGTWCSNGGTEKLKAKIEEVKAGDEFAPSWSMTAPSDAAGATIIVTARVMAKSRAKREIEVLAAFDPAALTSSMEIKVDAVRPNTHTALSFSPADPFYGQPVTFFVTVTHDESSAAADGTVDLVEAGTTIGSGALSGGKATIIVPSSAGQPYLSQGQHNIAAEYQGDDPAIPFAESVSAPVPPHVAPTVTSTHLTASPGKHSHVGDPVTFTATVTARTPDNGIPIGAPISGAVVFTDEHNKPIGMAYASSPGVWTVTATFHAAAQHTITAQYTPQGSGFAASSNSLPYGVLARQAQLTGQVLTSAGLAGITGVEIQVQDKHGQIQTAYTKNGTYSLHVASGEPAQLLFANSCTGPDGQTLFLKPPGSIYLGQASDNNKLPDVYYELRTCQVTGAILQQVGSRQQPLTGVQVNLFDPLHPATVYGTTTDAQGSFFFNPPVPPGGTTFTLQLPPTVSAGQDTLVLSPNQLGSSMAQRMILLKPDAPSPLDPAVYTPQLATLFGRVADGFGNPLAGIAVELSVHGKQITSTTNASGVYTFSNLQPGPVELRFQATTTDAHANEWELPAREAATQTLTIPAGQVVQADAVTYQAETHSIEQLVLIEGRPAEDVLVDVRVQGAAYAEQAKRTGRDGKVTFLLAAKGTFEVRVHPDPDAFGGPQVNVVECSSNSKAPIVNLAGRGSAGGGGGGGGRAAINADKAAIDLQAYPVLTQDFSPAGLPSATGPASLSTMGGTSSLGLTADRAIREVLSWRTKGDDPKGFVGALNQAFTLTDVEGHTEFTWTPRSYTVQTDMGAVTGAQASIYTRAKVALDQSMPLLDGLYALIPYVEPEDLATVQAVVRTQFSALVNEFGVVGGPRVPRVDELFELLLGPGSPTNPEEIKRSGSLGLVKQRFGLERRFVTTVDDEQNLTNYLILVDYVIGLKQSWNHDKGFFIRTYMGDTERRPFFGTQLVLMSRALEVVTQGVQDAYYTMDSVFMGDAERQTSQLDFAGLTVTIPDRRGGHDHQYTFPADTSGLFVAELLDWVYRAASEELPGLLQDAGKDGLESFTASTDRLRKFVHGAIARGQDARGLPPGYHTPRVRRAIQLLADGLDEAYRLAFEVRPPEFPAELTPEELRQIRQKLGI